MQIALVVVYNQTWFRLFTLIEDNPLNGYLGSWLVPRGVNTGNPVISLLTIGARGGDVGGGGGAPNAAA